MNTSQSIMNDQHRATPEQWQAIKANGHLPTRSTILELLCRTEALEATQQAHADASRVIDPEKEKMAQKVMQAAGFTPRRSESEGWHYIKDLYGKPADSQPQPNYPAKPDSSPLCVRCWAAAAAAAAHTRAKPNHPEILGTPLVDRVSFAICPDGQGTGFRTEARQAIREVAAWLQERYGRRLATIDLEQEAER